jgi:hypothetical protein
MPIVIGIPRNPWDNLRTKETEKLAMFGRLTVRQWK